MSLLSVKSQEQSIINEEHTFMCEPSDRPFKRAKLSNNNDNLTDSILFATPFTGAFVGVFTGPFTGFAQHLPKFFSETSYDEENDNILFAVAIPGCKHCILCNCTSTLRLKFHCGCWTYA